MKWCKIEGIKSLRKHVCELHESIFEYGLWGEEKWRSCWPHRYLYLLLSEHQCSIQSQPAPSHQELLTHLWNPFCTGKYQLLSIEHQILDEFGVREGEREVFEHDQVRNQVGFPVKKIIRGIVEIWCYGQNIDQIEEENSALLLWA